MMNERLLNIIHVSEHMPVDVRPGQLFIDTGNLPEGELMPGILLFNAPSCYLPVRAFVRCGSDLEQFVIQDGEQTIIFAAGLVREGDSVLLPQHGNCPPFLPTLNVSYTGSNIQGVRIIIEYILNPFFANEIQL